MSGRLNEEQMDQLETWIGKGPKIFTRIYSFSTDAPNGPTFHQKCDGQGPTVTVLYNTMGSIYGGYASVSWESTGKTLRDADTFLYQLAYSGTKTVNKFPCKIPDKAIYTYNSCGPVFGSNGHDLWTFNTASKQSDGTFTLDGYMSYFGNCYNSMGKQAKDVCNNIKTVVELEVYKVTDGRRQAEEKRAENPWRDIPVLNKKNVGQLKEDIGNIKPVHESGIDRFRILLLGPVGSGKSSFINTIDSVFKGRISRKVPCGTSAHSITSEYSPHTIRVQSGSTLPLVLCDTRGLEETQGPDILECNFLLDGHLPEYYQFNAAQPINVNSPEFVLKPTDQQRVHCVAFVLDASKVDKIPPKVMEKMHSFRTMIYQRKIPCAVLLTNIDKTGLDDTSSVFQGTNVETIVDKVSEKIGLPVNQVLPAKNYSRECSLNDGVSALSLVALQQLLHMCQDYEEMLADKMARCSVAQETRETTGSDTA